MIARVSGIWGCADVILSRPRVSEGESKDDARDRVNARSGASFEAASRRLRTKGAGGKHSNQTPRALKE